MITRYRFSTRIGMFCIQMLRSGAWRSMFGRKELGVFSTPESALLDLLEDPRDWPGGVAHSSLGLPADLADWAPSRKAPK